MNYKYEWKRAIVGFIKFWKEKQSNIGTLIITAVVIMFMMGIMNDKASKQLKDDNLILRDELLKSETKLQTTYYIIVRQGETIDRLKFELMKCKGDTIWIPEKENK